MVDYFRVLKTIVKSPGGRVEDVRWLEDLPQGDYLAAQDIVHDRLNAFLDADITLSQPALDALMLIDDRTHATVAALTQQYVQVISMAPEVDERLWKSVCQYYTTLAKAYQRFLDIHRLDPASFPHDLPQLILNILDCRRCLIKWHYFRQQSIGPGEWLRLHELYLLAEREGCVVHPLWRYRNRGETTITSTYLQVLLMGTLSPSDLLKHEVEMISGWLPGLCAESRLISHRIPSRRLFQIDLNEDRGGDWISRLPELPSFRYWDTDGVMSKVTRAHVDVQHGRLPAGLSLPPGGRAADCQPLLEHLLSEWSGSRYQRQRRAHARKSISMTSTVIDGFENVCQYFKNIAYAQRKGRPAEDTVPGKMLVSPVALQVDGGDEVADSLLGEWALTNESAYGYGAIVPAMIAAGLRPGRLLAFHGAQDVRFAVVGVVRNVKRLQDEQYYVAIEVLARRPVHVMLRSSDRKSGGWDPADKDIFLAATLIQGGGFPFGGLYLPKDEERHIPPTLLMPALEYVANGVFELRSEPYLYKVRLDGVTEQKDDWVCVEARIVEKINA